MEKERIACYVRVSTELEEQNSSFINQELYFRNKYANKEVLIYKDKGTGTSFRRESFQKMIIDAGLEKLDEKITKKKIVFIQSDREPLFKRIIVKDTSRFSRNIAIMDIIRQLSTKGVYIYFEDLRKDTSDDNDMQTLQTLFTFAESTSKTISTATKFGNQQSIEQNKIRNNWIYGYKFNRENNTLTLIESEAEIVRLIFNLALYDGFRVIAKKLGQMGIINRQGKAFSQHTLVNMLRSKKYAGFNVRGRFDSVDLFGDHKIIMKKRNQWIEMANERIDKIITEELFDKVQEKINLRCLHGNKGKNISKRDTSGKLKCGICGATYILALDTRLDDVKSRSYFICSHKKLKGIKYCNSKNIKKNDFDNFINEQRTLVYPNTSKLQIKLQIRQLQKHINELDKIDRFKLIRESEEELNQLVKQSETLMKNMLDNLSETMQKIFQFKIKELDIKIKEVEEEINNNQQIVLDKERYKKKVDTKIKELEKQKGLIQKELSREEYLKKVDKFIINSKQDIQVVLN